MDSEITFLENQIASIDAYMRDRQADGNFDGESAMFLVVYRNLEERLYGLRLQAAEEKDAEEKMQYRPQTQVLFETTTDKLRAFLSAGSAVFTLESKKTDRHFTYRINSKPNNRGEGYIYFCSVMTGGADKYSYMAVYDPENLSLVFTQKSNFSVKNESVRALLYFFDGLKAGKIPDDLNVYHAGRCGKCGKELTDPESIKLGVGPICRNGGT